MQTDNIGFSSASVREQFRILAVTWWLAFTLMIASLFVSMLFLPALTATILVTVHWCILLYRHWSLLQGHGARCTPGKAVGFGFIPIFWFYWWYVAYVGLAEDNNRHLKEAGITSVRMDPGLAFGYYLLNVLGCTIGLIPVVGVVLLVPTAIVGFILAIQQRDCILAILQHRSAPDQPADPAPGSQPLPQP